AAAVLGGVGSVRTAHHWRRRPVWSRWPPWRSLPKRRDDVRICFGRPAVKEAHDWYPGLLRARCERPRSRRAADERDELAPFHVWTAPAWQEITSRAAQKSLAAMCPACSRSPDGLLALMQSANRGLITRSGSMSQSNGRLLSVASDRPTVPSRVITLSQPP